MLLNVGVGDRDRFRDRGAHLVAEPGFDAEAEEEIRKYRDDYRRQHGNQAEQANEPHLQPGAGQAAAALGPDLDQAFSDQRRQQQQQHKVEIEQRQNDGGTRPERRRASQSQVGGNAGGQCRGRQRDRHLAPQRDAAGPAAPLARQSHAVLPAELGAEIASSTIFPRACRTAILPAT